MSYYNPLILFSRLAAPGSFVDATGGTITTIGNDRIHVFNVSGTFVVIAGGNVRVLWVGGGGGSASGPGGGGGVKEEMAHAIAPGSYSVSIGNGGIAALAGNPRVAGNGQNTVFDGITAIGGGGGAFDANPNAGGSGGGGGADGSVNRYGAAGTTGQGYKGGDQLYPFSPYPAAGGGGASSAGGDATGANSGGGGDGYGSNITGTLVYYGGGGSGISYFGSLAGTPGLGGTYAQTDGAANTGAGAGGQSFGNTGFIGGSGILVIRYQFQ